MSYTKGEWRIEKRDGHSDGVRPVITAMGVDRIAIVSYRGVPSIEEADANARLIAAAPKLLEACKAFVEAHEKSLQLEKTDIALSLAKQAISFAESK